MLAAAELSEPLHRTKPRHAAQPFWLCLIKPDSRLYCRGHLCHLHLRISVLLTGQSMATMKGTSLRTGTFKSADLRGSTARLCPLESGETVACRLASRQPVPRAASTCASRNKNLMNEQQHGNCTLVSRDRGPKLRVVLRGRRQIPGQIASRLLPTSVDEPFACLRWHPSVAMP